MIFRAWFRESFLGLMSIFPGEVLIEGCSESGELLLCETSCTLVVQRSFPVWLEVICDDLSSIFATGETVV